MKNKEYYDLQELDFDYTHHKYKMHILRDEEEEVAIVGTLDISNKTELSAFAEWLEQEVKPRLSDDEKAILRNLEPEFKYLAGVEINFKLYITVKQEIIQPDPHLRINNLFPNLFKFVKDGDCYLIEDLLKGV